MNRGGSAGIAGNLGPRSLVPATPFSLALTVSTSFTCVRINSRQRHQTQLGKQ